MEVPLGDLLGRISADLRRTLLCSSFTYPRALKESETAEPAAIEIELHDTLNFTLLKRELQTNVEALALAAREDLMLVVSSMEVVNDELNFDLFNCVEVRRGGYLLLRIRMPHDDKHASGRVAAIEINEYRRHVLKMLSLSNRTPLYLVLALGLAIGLAVNNVPFLARILAAYLPLSG